MSKKIGKKITKQNFEKSIEDTINKCFCEYYLSDKSDTLNYFYDKFIYKNDMIKERIYKLLMIANNAIKYILFIKPYTNNTETIKYYDEKEWRYVPDFLKQLIECSDEVVMEIENNKRKNSSKFKRQKDWLNRSVKTPLKFNSSDVRYIIVKDRMKSRLIDFIKNSSKYKDDYISNNFIILTESQIKEDM